MLLWRGRYQSKGLAGLADEPRSGRPRTTDHAAIVTATLNEGKRERVTNDAPVVGVLAQDGAGAWRQCGRPRTRQLPAGTSGLHVSISACPAGHHAIWYASGASDASPASWSIPPLYEATQPSTSSCGIVLMA